MSVNTPLRELILINIGRVNGIMQTIAEDLDALAAENGRTERLADTAIEAAALLVRNAQVEAVLELHALADFGECNECSNGTPWPCATVRAIEEAA